ncbi:Crp/Fnr family transcriptional regulator [Henriciella sp. AS95]|uniref:Crp/Fnr family transcriptional regulator n=1 Tax=Henriciella sp. AS95 TaxID=3135782 RepID=UPI00317E5FB7
MMHIAGRLNWIEELPQDAQTAIRQRFVYRNLSAGDVIGEAGQPSEGMYQVQSGYIKMLADQPDGERALLLIYMRGNCFGESTVIAQRPHHHTTVAASAARIAFLNHADFHDLYCQYPSIPEALCRKFATALSSMISFRETQSQANVGQRVARVLYNLAEVSDAQQVGQYREIDVPFTIADLSSFLGVTRQTVQKEISALKKRNLIYKLHGTWTVRDMSQLNSLTFQAEPVSATKD